MLPSPPNLCRLPRTMQHFINQCGLTRPRKYLYRKADLVNLQVLARQEELEESIRRSGNAVANECSAQSFPHNSSHVTLERDPCDPCVLPVRVLGNPPLKGTGRNRWFRPPRLSSKLAGNLCWGFWHLLLRFEGRLFGSGFI